jgi:hypothetical protein
MTQAGLAIGLTLVVHRRFPDFAPMVTTIILSSIVIWELVGPIATRFALIRSGEVPPHEPVEAPVLD